MVEETSFERFLKALNMHDFPCTKNDYDAEFIAQANQEIAKLGKDSFLLGIIANYLDFLQLKISGDIVKRISRVGLLSDYRRLTQQESATSNSAGCKEAREAIHQMKETCAADLCRINEALETLKRLLNELEKGNEK